MEGKKNFDDVILLIGLNGVGKSFFVSKLLNIKSDNNPTCGF